MGRKELLHIEEKKSWLEKGKKILKKHKPKIIIGGAIIVGGLISYHYISKKGEEDSTNLLEDTGDVADEIQTITTNNQSNESTNVTAHPRNLSKGRQASAEKRDSAEINGFTLESNQTWVKEHPRSKRSKSSA